MLIICLFWFYKAFIFNCFRLMNILNFGSSTLTLRTNEPWFRKILKNREYYLLIIILHTGWIQDDIRYAFIFQYSAHIEQYTDQINAYLQEDYRVVFRSQSSIYDGVFLRKYWALNLSLDFSMNIISVGLTLLTSCCIFIGNLGTKTWSVIWKTDCKTDFI